MLFSERMGFSEVKKVIQIDSIDDDLKNSLWNVFWHCYYEHYFSYDRHDEIVQLSKNIWISYFKEPIDSINFESSYCIRELKEYFFDQNTEWYEIYDLIEFISKNCKQNGVETIYMKLCNGVLEKEVSAYRFVAGEITRITSPEEIQEVEEAITNPSTNTLVKTHISNALELLSDRENPDYRNSIKESISAVECVVKSIVNEPNTTLGRALNKIKQSGLVDIHDDLNEGFKKIYHYTSDAAGIRHALKDDSSVDFEDAKFMLVSCSTFCNYLVTKADKAGINIA
ncbi:hypothetical protein NC661_04380 [Aquibacillus koreensis]|uniref:HEPN AbiJ-N-terminal domain-containing protein n=1 Tax=Aquibacillus koreensis TaxID=279446 RepID=A0A9X3WH18_9BACI|nr:hypothetical protein [Aquibacillus koreensis]MCT2534789.1 hypothetical protein [Aquibacillus koreensis]MDC3419600.1 hypothetical protein [Aquibacillus koreensis]